MRSATRTWTWYRVQLIVSVVGVFAGLTPQFIPGESFTGLYSLISGGGVPGWHLAGMTPDSAASRAGLRNDDVILSVTVNGRTGGYTEMSRTLDSHKLPVGTPVTFRIERNGRPMVLTGATEEPRLAWVSIEEWQFYLAGQFLLAAGLLIAVRGGAHRWRAVVVGVVGLGILASAIPLRQVYSGPFSHVRLWWASVTASDYDGDVYYLVAYMALAGVLVFAAVGELFRRRATPAATAEGGR